MAGAELGDPQGQVAVGLDALPVDEHVTGAVHRLDRERALLGLRNEHVGRVVIPVAAALPQRAVDELRALDLVVTGGFEALAHVLLDEPPQGMALRVPEDAADRLLLLVEQPEFAANTPMIALLGFLDAVQVGLELFLVGPGRAVDALQHFVAGVAAPVGAGQLGQLEGAELAGSRDVRPAAEVFPVTLAVERNVLARRDVLDDLRLVLLADRAEVRRGCIAGQHAPMHGQVSRCQLAHARLELLQILGREGTLAGEVIVKAVLDHRADGDLRLRIDGLHGLGQQVRGGVTDDLEPFRIARRDDAQRGVAVDAAGGVDQSAVHLTGEGRPGQPGADAGSHLGDRRRLFVVSLAAVGQRNDRHGLRSPVSCWGRTNKRGAMQR